MVGDDSSAGCTQGSLLAIGKSCRVSCSDGFDQSNVGVPSISFSTDYYCDASTGLVAPGLRCVLKACKYQKQASCFDTINQCESCCTTGLNTLGQSCWGQFEHSSCCNNAKPTSLFMQNEQAKAQCAKDPSCFDELYPCTQCCALSYSHKGMPCWDFYYTAARCCASKVQSAPEATFLEAMPPDSCAKDPSCFDDQYPCTSCCATGQSPKKDMCWDKKFTEARCCKRPGTPPVALKSRPSAADVRGSDKTEWDRQVAAGSFPHDSAENQGIDGLAVGLGVSGCALLAVVAIVLKRKLSRSKNAVHDRGVRLSAIGRPAFESHVVHSSTNSRYSPSPPERLPE